MSECKLDLVGIEEVRWDLSGTGPAYDNTAFHQNQNGNHHLGTDFCVHKRIISVINGVELLLIGDHILY
jgi:hypothetical protein